MKIACFLARMQPIHNAHLYIVKKMCLENDEVNIFLGSANKSNMIRNPFALDLREKLLKQAIEKEIGAEYADKIKVFELPDWTQEGDIVNNKEWGLYFYYNIVSRIQSKKFSIYFSDDPKIMLNWFEDKIQERINFVFLERDKIFDGLSATKIREAFSNNDVEYVKKYCPVCVVENFEYLKNIWNKVLNDPKNDFSME